MAQKENNIIPMIFDEAFYRKMATQKWRQQDYKKAAEYYEKVLELSPKDFDIQQHYAVVSRKIDSKYMFGLLLTYLAKREIEIKVVLKTIVLLIQFFVHLYT